ncbi:glycoside hydrolase family 3 N-terminal domain-containing protein [Paenibacillus aceris]|uniref:beta-glucosidase n=1 Tax=Paenibacillus aceris TaxID=869555 RepID=A0ABS4I0G4_9BACL|nr:glycoside hydrolase family 3 N-terminal domain-containing protein [Paenibacillus aceris]MBP1964409.1 beta-glucosidase-like glycosyl hydrolase [Paenibacillus aceris]NHW35877.1 beta-glucosidase [Paenibacillus aceris]
MRKTSAYVASVLLLSLLPLNYPNVAVADAVDIYKDPAAPIEQRVSNLLSKMTLDEKIGQMVQAEKASLSTVSDVQTYFLGSVLSGGGSVPAAGNNPTAWKALVDKYQNQALGSRLGIPIIYGVDAVHGHNNLQDATMFPHNVGLGAANDADLVKRISSATAEEVRATGIQWTFAPVISAVQNIRWGRTYEGYSEDPQIVSKLGVAAVQGLQGDPNDPGFLKGNKIVASIKHYIGDGLTDNGVNTGNITIPVPAGKTLNQAKDEYLAPYLAYYKKAVDAGARNVMITYSGINGLKSHADTHLITDVLKGQMGFTGFVVSDYDAIQQIVVDDQGNDVSGAANYKKQIKASVNAGVDMFMLSAKGNTTASSGAGSGWAGFINNLKSLVGSGDVSMARIDDAVTRVLRVKFENGLFEQPLSDSVNSPSSVIYNADHAALAREAARKSLVLLKNSSNVLPLKKDGSQKIIMIGDKASHIGYELGGWSLTWQGSGNAITKGTNPLDGIRNAVNAGATVDWDQTGATATAGHDIAIAVIGEDPYAEGSGDRKGTDLTYGTGGGASSDTSIVANLKAAKAANPNLKVVIILLSGRPLVITKDIDSWDAVVEAWLPGSEGGNGIADVVFGDYDFQGKLPYTWPRDFAEINAKDKSNPLFPLGYGLTYAATRPGSSLTGTDQANANQQFSLTYTLQNLNQNAFAQDVTVTYDPTKLEYVSANPIKDGVTIVDKKATSGQIRFILANVGSNHDANGDWLNLNFRVISPQSANASVIVSNVNLADAQGVESTVSGTSHSVQIIVVDKAALSAAIADAQSKYDAATEGSNPGQYPSGSKAALQAAITAATTVLNNTGATQANVNQAVTDLNAAIQTFTSSVIARAVSDVTGDGKISVGDLAVVAAAYGKTSTDSDWNQYKAADVNNDGKVDITDLAIVASSILKL